MTRWLKLAFLLGLAVATACSSGERGADDGTRGAARGARSYEVTGAVVAGDPAEARHATAVGVVDVAQCFAVIPEYQQIQGGKVSTASATYHFYLQKANQRLHTAAKSVARERSLPLVVESGGVRGDVEIVDLTEAVIARLQSP
jgi:hypothetical protein